MTAGIFFKDVILSVLNTVAPIKEVRLKQRSEPWVDSNILDLIKKGILLEFKKDKLKKYYTSYCSFRNIVQREVAKAKSDYLSNKMEENKNNPKKLWSQIKKARIQ